MAPSARTPRRGARDGDYQAIGVKGRRTGATLRDTGIRDEHGLEPVPTFSSPEKSAPKINGINGGTYSSYTEDVTMEIGDSTIPEPTDRLRNIKFPLPKGRSPKKTHTGSSPRRSIGPMSPSKRRETNTPTRAYSHPPPSSLAKRKFDESVNEPTPQSVQPSKLRRPTKTPPSARTARISFDVEDQLEPDETMGMTNGDVTINGYLDDDTPIQGIEDDSLPINQNQDDQEIEEETAAEPGAIDEEPSAIPETSQAEQKAHANPKDKKKRRGRPSVTSNLEDSQLSISKPRGRPPKVHPDAASEGGQSLSKGKAPSKKTKQPLKDVSPNRGPNAKLPRRNSTSKAPSRARSQSRARTSIVVRSETPAEGSGALITRSGRHSIKPLASWRGERAVFENDTLDKNGRTLGGITEIIRTDEIIESRPRKYPYRKKSGRSASVRLEDVEEEDGEMEDWERDTGVVNASVMGWDAVEGHFVEDQLDMQEIAYAASAIEMRDISGAEFRFAKTLTLPFFGSGIVDLPPGGAKRSKNSRKMQMVFFVFHGRVTVDVGTPVTRFGIGRGGQWQVPRGNFYSITNHSTTASARIFFAQGCEVGPDGGVSA